MNLIPETQPLTDERKQQIRLRHLLTMTSGIKGESHRLIGLGVTGGGGDYEIAVGKEPNRYGISAARMFADPGTSFEYSDAAFAHLSLLFSHVTGRAKLRTLWMSAYLPPWASRTSIGTAKAAEARLGLTRMRIADYTSQLAILRELAICSHMVGMGGQGDCS